MTTITAGRGSRRHLYLAAGGALALLVIIVIAAMTGAGTRASGGLPRDELVRRSIAALAAGDVGELQALASFDELQHLLTDCPDSAQMKQARQQQRTAFEQAVRQLAAYRQRRKLASVSLEVVATKVRTDENLALKKGQAANASGGPACAMKIDAAVHTLRVDVRVNRQTTESLKLIALEADAKWYLMAFTVGGGNLLTDTP